MRILITGNMGYVGPIVVRHLRSALPDAYLIGYDSGFFGHCLTGATALPERSLNEQIFGDVRHFPEEILSRVDVVIELAAISNDPMGSRYENVTDSVNHLAVATIAEKAVHAGVKSVVFASSCSMYGFAEGGARTETDQLNPLTAYARSKVAAEGALSSMSSAGTVITSLRFSTACGFSPRLRLDLVLNDFVACAVAMREISVISDGTPWRPLIEVRDMARAIEWAVNRDPGKHGNFLAVNVGSNAWNYRVSELAEAVADAVPGTIVKFNEAAPPDKRSYRVDFSLFQHLAPDHQPQISLNQAIRDLRDGLETMGFSDADFRRSQSMRLKVLENHQKLGQLDSDLYWR